MASSIILARADRICTGWRIAFELLRELRGSKLYDAEYKTRMTGKGVYADQTRQIFLIAWKMAGLTARFHHSALNIFDANLTGNWHYSGGGTNGLRF